MKRILFVCTGNTCRSPMAMGLFNRFISLESVNFEYEAVSAGTFACKGSPPSTNAILAVQDLWGIDISKHRSQALNQTEVEAACLVLTMELRHKHSILSRFPDTSQKVFTLKEYAYDTDTDIGRSSGSHSSNTSYSLDIADPYDSSLQDYKQCTQEIAKAVEKLIEKLKKS